MQGKDEAKVKAEGKGTGKGKFEGHGTGQGKRGTLARISQGESRKGDFSRFLDAGLGQRRR